MIAIKNEDDDSFRLVLMGIKFYWIKCKNKT